MDFRGGAYNEVFNRIAATGMSRSTTVIFSTTQFEDPTTTPLMYDLDYYPEMKELIHAHWYRFPPVSYVWHLLAGAIVLCLGVVSTCGNAAVIYIFSQTRGLRNPSNALIVNLAISDLAMMITECPMYFMSSLQGKWIFGVQACRFYGFCGALFGCASILTMAAIALDRYFVICKPFLIMKSAMTRERAKFAIVFVWAYCLVWAIIPLCGISNYVLEGFLTTCTFDYLDPSYDSQVFIFAMFIGAYVAPLGAICLCYMFIVWEVFSHARKFKKAETKLKVASNKQNQEEKAHKKEVKTAKIAAVLVGCWCMAWTPYAVVSLIGIYTDGTYLTPIASQLPALFAKCAGVYNPIVYAISHPKYREALRNKFPILRMCIKNEESDSGSERSSVTGSAPPTSRVGGNKKGLQSQISTTSQADSVDSELSDVAGDDNVATPQGKRRSSGKSREKAGKSGGTAANTSPIPAIRSGATGQRLAEQQKDAGGPSRSQAVFQEIVAKYSKGDQEDSVQFSNQKPEDSPSPSLPIRRGIPVILPDVVPQFGSATATVHRATIASSDDPAFDLIPLDIDMNAKVTTV